MTESLKTILHEHRYIKDALKKESKLPRHYWRIQLCRFFFLKGDVDRIPRALRSNFCPLFWFSNFLVLTSPIWLAVMLIGYLIVRLFDFIENFIVTPVKKKKQEWKKARMIRRIAQGKEEKKSEYQYNPAKPDPAKISCGRQEFEMIYKRLKDKGLVTGEPDWNSDELVQLVEEHCRYDEDYDSVYFVNFRRHCREMSWRRELARLREEENQRRERLRIKQEEEANIAKEKKRKRDAFFAKVFSMCKTFFQWLALIIALPVAVFLAYVLYNVVIFVGVQFITLCKFIFITHYQHTIEALVIAVIACVTLSFLYAFFSAEIFRKWFWRPLGSAWEVSCDNVIVPVAKGVACPFIWMGNKIAKVCEFVYDFGRMFMSENCPHITWEDEKPPTTSEKAN